VHDRECPAIKTKLGEKTMGEIMVRFKRAFRCKVCLMAGVAAMAVMMLLTGCGARQAAPQALPAANKVIKAVGAENEYADVISQIGGQYVSVSGIMKDPNVDPHSYEADTQDAALVAGASLIVENGLGYDDFMDKLAAASPSSNRTVIVAAQVLGDPATTSNPHLWFDPKTMPRVASAIAQALETQLPDHAQYFTDRLATFDNSLNDWNTDLADVRQGYAGAGVAVTEPVADYMLQAAGMNIKTPWGFQAAVMNGTDPSPQDVQTQENLLRQRQVNALIYNQQAVDAVTTTLMKLARDNQIPVVGVYETMPSGLTYQTWMEQETNNLQKALKEAASTETIS
jgi:zinc/manganese transport system substrate-binding protein